MSVVLRNPVEIKRSPTWLQKKTSCKSPRKHSKQLTLVTLHLLSVRLSGNQKES